MDHNINFKPLMTHSYKILNAQVAYDHADARDFLEVTVQVYLDGEELGEPKRFGFKLDAEEANIRAELDRSVATLDKELESSITNAEHEAQQAAAHNTIQALLDPKSEEDSN